MSSWSPILLPLLIGIAGIYYVFSSRAARSLRPIEKTASNVRRIRLRRINGAAMIFLAALLYVGAAAINARERPRTFLAVWIGVVCLLGLVLVLAVIDVRLTTRLRVGKNDDGS